MGSTVDKFASFDRLDYTTYNKRRCHASLYALTNRLVQLTGQDQISDLCFGGCLLTTIRLGNRLLVKRCRLVEAKSGIAANERGSSP
mmetsp:Transcript_21464/g.40753  ORF Transcript_21464/g.40753 Transcript_21464/m.40753 type:complete len:87 (-) Transcript_21464:144-404(-)